MQVRVSPAELSTRGSEDSPVVTWRPHESEVVAKLAGGAGAADGDEPAWLGPG